MPPEVVAAAAEQLSTRIKDDLRFAHDRVRRFAEAQMASIEDFDAVLSPGPRRA